MRKMLALLLSIALCTIVFSGCNQYKDTHMLNESVTQTDPDNGNESVTKTDPDVWDGSIAEAFATGDGSENKPYVIENASQLAYLSKEVNLGTDYQGKYFTLNRDLDLNNIEWTPIGNGINSFNGIFDGKSHTISNLKITSGAHFTTTVANIEINKYTIGLFGSCYDATLKNISINKASVNVQDVASASCIMGGILLGSLSSDSSAEISNIAIANTDITCEFFPKTGSSSLRLGGIIGDIDGNEGSSIKINNINSDTTISIQNGDASYNIIGGIAGSVSAFNLMDVNNCASYLSVMIDAEDPYIAENYFGAFGSMTARNNIVSISNIFSKVTTNAINVISHGYATYTANAIMGTTSHGKQKDGSVIGGYKLNNLFGYVEQVDAITGEIAKSTQLYELPSHALYTENNCIGCESLPADHGFDTSIWNLKDLSKPQVKIK